MSFSLSISKRNGPKINNCFLSPSLPDQTDRLSTTCECIYRTERIQNCELMAGLLLLHPLGSFLDRPLYKYIVFFFITTCNLYLTFTVAIARHCLVICSTKNKILHIM